MGIFNFNLETFLDPAILISIVGLLVMSLVLYLYIGDNETINRVLVTILIPLAVVISLRSVLVTYTGLSGTLTFIFASLGAFIIMLLMIKFISVLSLSAFTITSLVISMYFDGDITKLIIAGAIVVCLVLTALCLGEGIKSLFIVVVTSAISSWAIVYSIDFFVPNTKVAMSGMIDDVQSGTDCIYEQPCLTRLAIIAALILMRFVMKCAWNIRKRNLENKKHDESEQKHKESEKRMERIETELKKQGGKSKKKVKKESDDDDDEEYRKIEKRVRIKESDDIENQETDELYSDTENEEKTEIKEEKRHPNIADYNEVSITQEKDIIYVGYKNDDDDPDLDTSISGRLI